MKYIQVILLGHVLSGCFGARVGGTTYHETTVSGEVVLVIKIDVSECSSFSDEEKKLECIKSTISAFRELNNTIKTFACYQNTPEDFETCVEGTSDDEIVTKLYESGV